MTTWTRTALILTALAGLLFWALLPDETEPVTSWREAAWRDHPQVIAAIRRANVLEQQRSALARREERAIARAVVSGARVTGALTLTADPLVPTATRARFDSLARRELAIAGDTRVPIVVHLAADTVRGSVYGYLRAVVIPRTAEAPCGVVVTAPTHRLAELRLSDEDRLLGVCAFYARHGRPGAGMQQWLVDTRQLAAGYLTEPPSLAGDTTVASLSRQYQEAWTLRGCRAGDRHLCDLVFTPTREVGAWFDNSLPDRLAASWAFGDVAVSYPGQITNAYSRMGEGLLGALAGDLGPARFEAIWTSADAPAAAYAKAEGRPLSDWTLARAERLLEPYRRGPGVPMTPWVLALALLVATWAGTTALTARRMS